MRILERVQPFCASSVPHSNIEIFYLFFSSQLGKNKKKSQNSNEVKNGCTPSRVRIDIKLRAALYISTCIKNLETSVQIR